MGRPPADKIIYEVFYDKKCGKGATHDKFFQWCGDTSGETPIEATCEGVAGGAGECTITASFTKTPKFLSHMRSLVGRAINLLIDPSEYDKDDELIVTEPSIVESIHIHRITRQAPAKPNATSPTSNISTTIAPKATTAKPKPVDTSDHIYFNYDYVCEFGSKSKRTNITSSYLLPPDEFEKIQKYCRQEMYGIPWDMPWWLILLILVLVLAAVSVATGLFWSFWLKKRIYGPGPRQPMTSRIESYWTTSPASTTSAVSGLKISTNAEPQRSKSKSRSLPRSGSNKPSSVPMSGSTKFPSASKANSHNSMSSASVKTIQTKVSHKPSAPSIPPIITRR